MAILPHTEGTNDMHLSIPDGHPSLEVLIGDATQRVEDVTPFGCDTPDDLVKFLTHVANAPMQEALYDVLVVHDHEHDLDLLLRRRSDGVLAVAEHVENDEYVDNDVDGFAFVTTGTRTDVRDRFLKWASENAEEDAEQAMRKLLDDMKEVVPAPADLLATDRMAVDPVLGRLDDVLQRLHDPHLKASITDALVNIRLALG